jgi:hypothetical protein
MEGTYEFKKMMTLGGNKYAVANPVYQALSFEKLEPASESGIVEEFRVKLSRASIKAIQLPSGNPRNSGRIEKLQSGELRLPKDGVVRVDHLGSGKNRQRIVIVCFTNLRLPDRS